VHFDTIHYLDSERSNSTS